MIGRDLFILSEEVKDALSQKQAVVALESTILTHGMPTPENLDTARAVETIVRTAGAVLATIAILEGVVHVGVSERMLEQLVDASPVMKASRADFAFAIANKKTASTTVAATMILARHGGIDVFATGGIGGVHRGAASSFDVSADLYELARTAVTVVSSGPKAILDIPATLEVLESLGVPVIGYNTCAVPAFWSPESGCTAFLTVDSVQSIIRFIKTRQAFDLSGGTLIMNPIQQADAIPQHLVEGAMETALIKMEKMGVTGKEVTPFLLSAVNEQLGGKALAANIALIKNNARLAAEITTALSRSEGDADESPVYGDG